MNKTNLPLHTGTVVRVEPRTGAKNAWSLTKTRASSPSPNTAATTPKK